MNGRLALIKSQLLLSNYVSCLLAALSWLSAEWDISGSLPGIRAIPLHWAWTEFSIMGISESSWGSREVTLEFSWDNPADGVLFQSGDGEPKAGGDHEGFGFMEDPQSSTPLQAPHKSIWKNVYNSCSIFASTWQNSATWWSHRAKTFAHMFNFHSVYLFHISSAFFCIYVFLYFQLLLDFFAYIQVFIPHVHLSFNIFKVWILHYFPDLGLYIQLSHIFSFLPINSGVFVYIDISFQILNFHSVYLRFLFLYVQHFC